MELIANDYSLIGFSIYQTIATNISPTSSFLVIAAKTSLSFFCFEYLVIVIAYICIYHRLPFKPHGRVRFILSNVVMGSIGWILALSLLLFNIFTNFDWIFFQWVRNHPYSV